jgi:hypothetical protein
MHPMRRAGVLLLLVLLCACRADFERSGSKDYGTKKTPAPKDVGDDVALPTPTPGTTAALPTSPPPSRFVLRLTDSRGLHPASIPIQVSGPVTAVMKTDGDGEITLTRAGTYQLQVVTGCSADVQVFSGGRASAGVVPGKPSRGELRVDWRHRMMPSPPIFSDPSAPWPVNTDVRVSFKVVDRCTQRFAPNASYPTFKFGTSPNLRLSKSPVLRSDAKSTGYVTVRCVAKGDVKLIAFDGANPTDSLDMKRESSDFAEPSCV